VRLVPAGGGELRVPHLLLLFAAVEHLPSAHSLTVTVPVPRGALPPSVALARLQAAAEWVAADHQIPAEPVVQILDAGETQLRFRASLAGAPEALRNDFLLALLEAVSAKASAREEAAGGSEQ
jgi:hypothetical protein